MFNRKPFFLTLLILVIMTSAGCRQGDPNYAQKPVELTEYAYKRYQDYKSGYYCGKIYDPSTANQAKKRRGEDDCKRGTPELFITDRSGQGAYLTYCPSGAHDYCEPGRARDEMMRRCRERFGKCFIIDEGGFPLHPITQKGSYQPKGYTKSSNKADKSGTIQLVGGWEGKSSGLKGQLRTTNSEGRGQISFENSYPKFSCNGEWKYVSGSYKGSSKPRGTWSANCSNGEIISGTYVSDKPGQGRGFGADSKGRKIEFFYG